MIGRWAAGPTRSPRPSATQPDHSDGARRRRRISGRIDRMDLAELYRDLHEHPELSEQETRTAAIAAKTLTGLGYETTTGVGGTGVVGVLRRGAGPAVLLRADMDALPVAERTGLPYASTARA